MALKLVLMSGQAIEKLPEKEYENFNSFENKLDFKLTNEQEKNLKEINFDGIYFRNDIGHQVRKNFFKEN